MMLKTRLKIMIIKMKLIAQIILNQIKNQKSQLSAHCNKIILKPNRVLIISFNEGRNLMEGRFN